MPKPLTALPLMAACAATAACVSLASAAKADDCMPDWGQAGAIVRAQKLLTVGELTKLVAQDVGGTIIQATLCKDSDDYIYKLVVKDRSGQLKTVVLDARGRGLPAARP